jgi:hypothetical protein
MWDLFKKPQRHSADLVCQTWSQVWSLADLAKSSFTCNSAQSLGYPQLMKVSQIFIFNGILTQETLVSDRNLHQMHGSTVVYMYYSYSLDLLKSSSLLIFNPLYKILSTTIVMSLTNNYWRNGRRTTTVNENIQENNPSMMQKTFFLSLYFAP